MTGITDIDRTGPACWFCNSSGFWLTRCFNKHTAIILTREGARVVVKKAGAPETRTMAAGGSGTHCPPALLECCILMWHRGHCWERLPPPRSPQDTCSTPVPCYTKASTDIPCAGKLNAAAEGLHICCLCAGHTKGKWKKMRRGFIFLISLSITISISLWYRHAQRKTIKKGADMIIDWHAAESEKWKRGIHDAGQFLAEKKYIKRRQPE